MGNPNSLTVRFVDTVKTPGTYRDKGNPGLLLRVDASGAKRWVARITFNGKRRERISRFQRARWRRFRRNRG